MGPWRCEPTCRWPKQNNVQCFNAELLLVPLVLDPQMGTQEGSFISCNPAHKMSTALLRSSVTFESNRVALLTKTLAVDDWVTWGVCCRWLWTPWNFSRTVAAQQTPSANGAQRLESSCVLRKKKKNAAQDILRATEIVTVGFEGFARAGSRSPSEDFQPLQSSSTVMCWSSLCRLLCLLVCCCFMSSMMNCNYRGDPVSRSV